LSNIEDKLDSLVRTFDQFVKAYCFVHEIEP
jgi:hypothetical protein